jgi:hypothetical protein
LPIGRTVDACAPSTTCSGLIPHKKLRRKKVKLPARSMQDAYDDLATLEGRRFVETRY